MSISSGPTPGDSGSPIAEEGSQLIETAYTQSRYPNGPRRSSDLNRVRAPIGTDRKEGEKVHKIKLNNEDNRRIFEKKKILYKGIALIGYNDIGDLAAKIGKSRQAIYNAINYLPYRDSSVRLGCFPTAQAIGRLLGWDELDINQWYNGNL